ncbi:MAG: hypothetical protein ACXWCZ_13520 [Flavisolibacter sp.]
MLQEEKFWQWFENHQSEYLHLDELDYQRKEFLLDQFLKRLHEYCDKLYFQIGGTPAKERRELVISAEGNLEYFEAVEKLISAAPELNNWKVVGFKQPMGTDFITEYGELVLDPKKMWFLPLNNEQDPKMIGIKICIDKYDSNYASKFKQAVYQVLDTILGEKATATELNYLDVGALSDYDPEKDGLIELVELSNYITWKKASVPRYP